MKSAKKEKSDFQKYLEFRDWVSERPIKFRNEVKKAYANESLYDILASATGFFSYFYDNPVRFHNEKKEFEPIYESFSKVVEIDHSKVLLKMRDGYKSAASFEFLINKGAKPSLNMIKNHMRHEGPVASFLAENIESSDVHLDDVLDLLDISKSPQSKISYDKVLIPLLNKVSDEDMLSKILYKVLCSFYDNEQRKNIVEIIKDKGVSYTPMSQSDLLYLRDLGFKESFLNRTNHPTELLKLYDDDIEVDIHFDGTYFVGTVAIQGDDFYIDSQEIPPVSCVKNLQFIINEISKDLLDIN